MNIIFNTIALIIQDEHNNVSKNIELCKGKNKLSLTYLKRMLKNGYRKKV
jgi:hypothetical protein